MQVAARTRHTDGRNARLLVPDTLDQWQERLKGHFAALANARRGYSLPLFALEHGLDASERETIASLLNDSLGVVDLARHWLVWVVYAAEQGYHYDGEEYWTTFEKRTPNWINWADRRMLRRWFGRFHEQYGGFKPTGAWAAWFSIIAWPITHALLPRDLQTQLARALYDWRYPLAQKLEGNPAEIGRFLASVSHDASSRFQNFLQQEEMAGRIVLALLRGRAEAVERFIHPMTLERIVADLQKANTARAWLRDARQAVERLEVKGISRSAPGSLSGGSGYDRSGPSRTAQPHIRPALTLRRTAAGEWTPVVELPTLRPLADLAPDLNKYLRVTRCSVAGSAGTLPAGWLMLADQRRVLTSWPAADQPIIRFENPPAMLDHLLRADGCITAGPRWLFRVGADGLAREIIGRMVRPGYQYVLVSTAPIEAPRIGEPVSLTASGAAALILDLHEQLTSDAIAALRALQLGVAQTIRVAPAGLDARRWDGEGFAEWMDGETPCLVIHSDYPVESYALRLDDGLILTVATNGHAPVFLKLTDLATGPHTFTVEARSRTGEASGSITGYLSLTLRPPRAWIAGTTGHSGLVVTSEPQEPSLDQLWESEVNVQVLGPAPTGRPLRPALPQQAKPPDPQRRTAEFGARPPRPWPRTRSRTPSR